VEGWEVLTVSSLNLQCRADTYIVASQIATSRYALAVGSDITHAVEEVKAAHDAMDPYQSAKIQEATWNENTHALATIEDLLKHDFNK
jgi:hypothetical protein